MILKKKYFIIFTMSLLMLPLAFSQITIKEKLNVGSPHARTQDESHTLVFSFSRPAGVITQTPDESHQLLLPNTSPCLPAQLPSLYPLCK